MNKTAKILVAAIFIVVLAVPLAHSYASSKCTVNCTDPNAPTYDVWGNEFAANGSLIKSSNEKADPVSHKQNPYYLLWQADHGDLDHNGIVNIHDLSIFLSNYGKSY